MAQMLPRRIKRYGVNGGVRCRKTRPKDAFVLKVQYQKKVNEILRKQECHVSTPGIVKHLHIYHQTVLKHL